VPQQSAFGPRGFPISAELLILNDTVMRAATVLIVMFSMLSAPLASAVCRDCCNRSVEHQLPICHDKAHAHLGPHVHHMNHVHMVTDDSDARSVTQDCDHQFHDSRLSCHTAACLSAKPLQTPVVSAPSNQQQIPSHLLATAICSSLTISRQLRPPGECRLTISSSQSASVPLRI
jgi:hypothetical protein